MIGHIILRLTMWFLLTANFTPANIMIGVAIAFLLHLHMANMQLLKTLCLEHFLREKSLKALSNKVFRFIQQTLPNF